MRTILFILTLFLLTSCIEKLKEGIITAKFYEPERKWTTTHHNPTTHTTTTHHHRDDEDYVFMVNGETSDGENVTQRFEISKSNYHKYEIGDSIKFITK